VTSHEFIDPLLEKNDLSIMNVPDIEWVVNPTCETESRDYTFKGYDTVFFVNVVDGEGKNVQTLLGSLGS